MDALDRFQFHRKKFRRKLGGVISHDVGRHLDRAASIAQILEATRHEVLTGREHDPVSIKALQDQLPIELMHASIEAGR